MSTLHTKYRPDRFEDVIGQAAAVKSLQSAIKARTGQTFLFCGPSGTGKTTLARIAAKQAGSSSKDILEIDAATYTGADDMRAVAAQMQYSPFGEKAVRSIIVDECHMLSKAAWNSLLKPSEEPPPWAYWFFCTTEPTKVPVTIVTRCLKYELKLVAYPALYELVDFVAHEEKFKTPTVVMELCAKEAGGSPRQALVNLAACAEAKDRKEAVGLLKSADDSSEVKELIQALLTRKPWKQVQLILQGLKETNPESIRHNVRGYITAVILSSDNEDKAGMACEILDAFSVPFNGSDGISPVVLACAKVILSGE